MKLSGKNFQSLAEFAMDIRGLTVLVGPSNKGKSAVFRALKGLFRNELPADYIRAGSGGLELAAEADGHTVVAERGTKGSTEYRIDGREFKKLALTVPPELKAFGMNEVRVGEYTIDPVFARQNGKQFLVDSEAYTPTEINTVFGAFASTEKLEAGKKLANLEIQRKNAEAKTIAAEIADARRREADSAAFAAESASVAGALRALQPDIDALEQAAQWARAAQGRLAALRPLREILSELSVPDIGEAEALRSAHECAVQATNSFRLGNLYRRASKAVSAAQVAGLDAEAARQAIAAVGEVAELGPNLDALRALSRDFNRFFADAKNGLLAAEVLQHSIMLVAALARAREEASALHAQRELNDSELAKNSDEIKRLSTELATCPKCGFQFDPKHKCEGTNA